MLLKKEKLVVTSGTEDNPILTITILVKLLGIVICSDVTTIKGSFMASV
jgi:hypothetical protein